MRVEPTTEIDRQIAEHWPQRWDQANDPAKKGNAKRRNKLRREWCQAKAERVFATEIEPHYRETLARQEGHAWDDLFAELRDVRRA